MNLASSRLVQHIYFRPVSKSCLSVNQNNIYVLNEAIITDEVIGYVILNVLYYHIVTDLTIVDNSVIDTGVFF
ncbi:hypothetical protein SDC9_187497 [bioreactor metagenome]|uniref:Uncharacterized protein n=1 Tax=bioreactor metagenome TaxID=1076179 RepID=A0A645HND2_9ZZZZ